VIVQDTFEFESFDAEGTAESLVRLQVLLPKVDSRATQRGEGFCTGEALEEAAFVLDESRDFDGLILNSLAQQ